MPDYIELQGLPNPVQEKVKRDLHSLRRELLIHNGEADAEGRVTNPLGAWALCNALAHEPTIILHPQTSKLRRGDGTTYMPEEGPAVAALDGIRASLDHDEEKLLALLKAATKDWLLIHPKGPLKPRRDIVDPPVRAPWSVCSDVHLGTDYTRSDDFYRWLRQHEKGQTVVLLGDILDFWICTADDKDEAALVTRVLAEWETLWNELATLRERGIKVVYVPGNHDNFVFFVEVAEQFDWAQAIMDRTPELREVRDRTAHLRLTEVASIHYPCYQPTDGVLYTHGHYDEFLWQLLGGIREAFPKNLAFIATATLVYAHKNARFMRRVANSAEAFTLLKGVEETAYTITNAILRAYQGAREMADRDLKRMATLIDNATAIAFGTAPRDLTPAEEMQIRTAFLAVHRHHERINDLVAHRRSILDLLLEVGDSPNYELPQSSGGGAAAKTTPLRDFAKAGAAMVIGHHHQPRDHDLCHDVGGFNGSISTTLEIDADGIVSRI